MLRTSIAQKQCEISKRNYEVTPRFSLEPYHIAPSYIIKTMMDIIKTKSEDSMNMETRAEFLKITDAIVRMAEEIRA